MQSWLDHHEYSRNYVQVVLTPLIPLDDYPEGTTQETVDIDDEIWKGLQDELTALSSNSKLLIATESSHGIPRQQPQIIVDGVKELYESKLH